MRNKYLLAMEKGVEIIGGILIIIRRFVPLVLVVLASIIINILAFHIFVDSELLPLALLVVLLEGILVWFYRDSFNGVIGKQAENTLGGMFMKAIVSNKYGTPDTLELKEVEKPKLKDNQVLVKIHAASVNYGNLVLLKGEPFLARLAFGLLKPKYSIPWR